MSRKKRIQIGLVIGILLAMILLAFIVYPFVGIFLWVTQSAKEIKKAEASLQLPAIYEPVAKRLAIYCQSDLDLFPKSLSQAWFPSELHKVGDGWGVIKDKYAQIEMGGGFHHFGYRLNLGQATLTGAFPVSTDPTSTLTNVWELFLYSEGSKDKLLTRFPLLAAQRLTKEEVRALVESGYDHLIRSHPGAYKGKIMTLLRFGKAAQAADECSKWIELQPDHWLPRFTLAHLRCRLGESDAAATEFTHWVHANKNFAHCIYLALFNYREGRTNDSVKAVQLALGQPFVEPPDTSGNKFYLGHNGAFIAYLAGDYGLCLTACDKMLADRRNEETWKKEVSLLRAAAVSRKNSNPAETTETGTQPVQYKPSNELLDWFTPFDTDEAGWHGSEDIPSPFPERWRLGNTSSN